MTGRKGMDSAVSRRSGNVYNRPSYGAVGNAVCRLWESSFYFSTGCEWRFPWRNGRLCTFPLCYLFVFQQSQCSAHSIGQRPMKRSRGTRSQLRHGAVRGIGGFPPTSGFAEQNGRVCTTLPCLPILSRIWNNVAKHRKRVVAQ